MDSQLAQYVPVLFLALLAVAFAAARRLSVLLGRWANRIRRTKTQGHSLRMRMLPIGEGARTSVSEVLSRGMLFILFDIEVVFLYPWAVVYRHARDRREPDL